MSESKQAERLKMTSYTKGPWAWYCNKKNGCIQLATLDRGRRYVMGFERVGMQGAQPIFNTDECIMISAVDAGGEPDHNGYFELTHPDARLIAAAPDLLEALKMTQEVLCDRCCNAPLYHCPSCEKSTAAIAKAEEVEDAE